MSEFVAPQGNYGRVWESVYQGSLVGAGLAVFAVWPYVITNMKRSDEHGAVIMLNPTLLASVFGKPATAEVVQGAIDKLCAPDPNTKNGVEEQGRRLVKVSGFCYRVVNGEAYMNVRARESHAAAQARYRERVRVAAQAGGEKRKRKGLELKPGQTAKQAIAAKVNGEAEADQRALEGSPGMTGETPEKAAPTAEEYAKWLKEHPEDLDKNAGEGMGPAVGPVNEAGKIPGFD